MDDVGFGYTILIIDRNYEFGYVYRLSKTKVISSGRFTRSVSVDEVFQWINSSYQRELLSRKSLYGEVFGSLNDF